MSEEYHDEDHYLNEILHTESSFLKRDRAELQELASMGGSGPLLDVGAGAGTLLRAALDMGWEATGIEISHPSAEHLRSSLKIEIHERPMEETPIRPESYGLVTFSHSLEHVPDPVGVLRHAARALRPGGLVHIAVPNWNAAKRLVTGLQVPWIYKHHISYFSHKTLCWALMNAGFEPLVWRYDIFGGEDYAFVIALLRAMGLEGAVKRFLNLGNRPLEELVTDDVKIQCPPWKYRAVLRLARAILLIWPERLLSQIGRSEELRVTAQKQ
ncbi:MAG: class I SAM-dependent methyltransferase [Planctomycetota bacterium]